MIKSKVILDGIVQKFPFSLTCYVPPPPPTPISQQRVLNIDNSSFDRIRKCNVQSRYFLRRLQII